MPAHAAPPARCTVTLTTHGLADLPRGAARVRPKSSMSPSSAWPPRSRSLLRSRSLRRRSLLRSRRRSLARLLRSLDRLLRSLARLLRSLDRLLRRSSRRLSRRLPRCSGRCGRSRAWKAAAPAGQRRQCGAYRAHGRRRGEARCAPAPLVWMSAGFNRHFHLASAETPRHSKGAPGALIEARRRTVRRTCSTLCFKFRAKLER